jgi:hypothetical protein
VPALSDLFISFIIGVASNLATDVLKRSWRTDLDLSERWDGVQAVRKRRENVMWSFPSTFGPIGMMYLTRYRWPLAGSAVVIIVIGTFVVSFIFGFVWSLISRRQSGNASNALSFNVVSGVLFLILFFALDVTLPRYVSLECPHGRTKRVTTFAGRVIDPTATVKIDYWPLGNAGIFSFTAPPAGKDGLWYATITLGGAAGEKYQVVASVVPDRRTDLCTVELE